MRKIIDAILCSDLWFWLKIIVGIWFLTSVTIILIAFTLRLCFMIALP